MVMVLGIVALNAMICTERWFKRIGTEVEWWSSTGAHKKSIRRTKGKG